MTENQVIAKTIRRVGQDRKDFSFSKEMVRIPENNGYLKEYRQKAWEIFKTLPMPSLKDEPWRRTDLRALRVDQFQSASTSSSDPALQKMLTKVPSCRHCAGQVFFSASDSSNQMEENLAAQGVIFCDLIQAEKSYPQILEKIIGKIVHPEEGKFAAMAAALAQNGVLLYVPPNKQIDLPLQSIFWASGVYQAYFSHILVYIDTGASVSYVHESLSSNEKQGQILHAGNIEIYVGQGAHLKFIELQSFGGQVWNFSNQRIRVDQDGSLEWVIGAFGSRLTKQFSELELYGKGASGKMSGFYISAQNQHLDYDTQQNHLAPSTSSDLLFKGALLGSSRTVWQGMVYVAPEAIKADGYQANRNLLLSSKARADSIPGLEIKTDDVRCSHGATVGKIDEEQIFYLLSRGIPQEQAEKLVVEGFFDPILQRIPIEALRKQFQKAIIKKVSSK